MVWGRFEAFKSNLGSLTCQQSTVIHLEGSRKFKFTWSTCSCLNMFELWLKANCSWPTRVVCVGCWRSTMAGVPSLPTIAVGQQHRGILVDHNEQNRPQ